MTLVTSCESLNSETDLVLTKNDSKGNRRFYYRTNMGIYEFILPSSFSEVKTDSMKRLLLTDAPTISLSKKFVDTTSYLQGFYVIVDTLNGQSLRELDEYIMSKDIVITTKVKEKLGNFHASEYEIDGYKVLSCHNASMVYIVGYKALTSNSIVFTFYSLTPNPADTLLLKDILKSIKKP